MLMRFSVLLVRSAAADLVWATRVIFRGFPSFILCLFFCFLLRCFIHPRLSHHSFILHNTVVKDTPLYTIESSIPQDARDYNS